jgi:hypothetical protein
MRENKYLINTIQEITLQAYEIGIYDYFFNERNMSRTDIFLIFVEWAKEFEETHENFDWMQGSFYDEVDDFLECRFDSIKIADKVRDAFPGGITKGDYLSYEGGIYKITGFTAGGIEVEEIVPRPDNAWRIVSLDYELAAKDGEVIKDYEEIMDTGNGHDKELVRKINAAWNKNSEAFREILCALYARDIDEITDSDAFRNPKWEDTTAYKVGFATDDWSHYNKMVLGEMTKEWDKYAENYLMHIADDGDLECILGFIR